MTTTNTTIVRMKILPEELAAAAWIATGEIPSAVAGLVPPALRPSALQSGLRGLLSRNMATIGAQPSGEQLATLHPSMMTLVGALTDPSTATRLEYFAEERKATFLLLDGERGACSLTLELLGTVDVMFGPAGSGSELRSLLLPAASFTEVALATTRTLGSSEVMVLCDEISDGGRDRSTKTYLSRDELAPALAR